MNAGRFKLSRALWTRDVTVRRGREACSQESRGYPDHMIFITTSFPPSCLKWSSPLHHALRVLFIRISKDGTRKQTTNLLEILRNRWNEILPENASPASLNIFFQPISFFSSSSLYGGGELEEVKLDALTSS